MEKSKILGVYSGKDLSLILNVNVYSPPIVLNKNIFIHFINSNLILMYEIKNFYVVGHYL